MIANVVDETDLRMLMYHDISISRRKRVARGDL